ncbi:MAG TPA: transposase [Acidimicrobiales bacterium]|nr:transposase [Acidimicrobiales bacterium]
MAWRPRRRFTPEFKAEVVGLARSPGKSIGQLRRDLDLIETAVCERVWAAAHAAGARSFSSA